MKIFFDTNALVNLINHPDSFPDLSGYSLYTFEKCVYEFNNGLKTKLFDQEFIIRILKRFLRGIEPDCV